jgi:hypothetical protein
VTGNSSLGFGNTSKQQLLGIILFLNPKKQIHLISSTLSSFNDMDFQPINS